MIWGVPMLPNSFSPDSNVADKSGSAYGLVQGASGVYNSYFLKLAEEMVAGGQGSASSVRVGNSMAVGSLGRKGAGGGVRGLLAADRDHDALRAGQDFRFEWNPTAGDQGVGISPTSTQAVPTSTTSASMSMTKRGRRTRDLVGMEHLPDRALRTELAGVVRRLGGKAHHASRVGLDPDPSSNDGGQVSQPGTEVGGGDDPTFINDMAQWIKQNDVFDATYWDYGSSRLSRSSNPTATRRS